MIIEIKKISATERALFFTVPFKTETIFYADDKNPAALPLLKAAQDFDTKAKLLFCKDLLYFQASDTTLTDDLESLCLAELDDFNTAEISLNDSKDINNIPEKIRIILKTAIAPYLQKDGGDIEFAALNGNKLQVRFLGRCNGCPYAERTLKERVTKTLVRYFPQITEVTLV